MSQRQCKHEGCTKPAYASLNKRTGKLRKYTLCNTHRNEAEKRADLARWSYRKHKSNAKRRGKPFTITLEYFRQFAAETLVLLGSGRSATSLHVDCIIEALGYVPGNLQVLTNTENVRKENERRMRVKQVIYDYDLAARRRCGYTYADEHEAALDEGLSVFRAVDYSFTSTDTATAAPDEDVPF